MKISYLRVRNKWKNIDNQKEYNIYFNRKGKEDGREYQEEL